MNLKKIAEVAGVSVSTVSRALNGNPRISMEVRRRVVEIARDHGYVDRRFLAVRQLALQSITLIVPEAMLEPGGRNFVSWRVLEQLRRECDTRGVRIDPVVCAGDRINADIALKGARASDADAIIVHFDENPELLRSLTGFNKPVVLLLGLDPSSQVSSVGVGNAYASSLGFQYLQSLGHRNIQLVSWPGRHTIRRRETGFREAAHDSGIENPQASILRLSSYEPEVAEREYDAYLARNGGHPAHSAIFCLSDNIAIGVTRSLAKAGLAVPGDVSVLGFDDSIAGQMNVPPLTSIRQPLEEIGSMALFEIDLALMRGSKYLPRRVEVGCTISERGSCGKISAI